MRDPSERPSDGRVTLALARDRPGGLGAWGDFIVDRVSWGSVDLTSVFWSHSKDDRRGEVVPCSNRRRWADWSTREAQGCLCRVDIQEVSRRLGGDGACSGGEA